MEELVLTVKFVALYALEVFVVAVVGAALVVGLYQVVRNRIRAAAPESRVAAPATVEKR